MFLSPYLSPFRNVCDSVLLFIFLAFDVALFFFSFITLQKVVFCKIVRLYHQVQNCSVQLGSPCLTQNKPNQQQQSDIHNTHQYYSNKMHDNCNFLKEKYGFFYSLSCALLFLHSTAVQMYDNVFFDRTHRVVSIVRAT